MIVERIASFIPGVGEPKGYLNFKSRLKWTGMILLVFLVLGQITLYGIEPAETERVQFLELILGASIGTLMTLGIGPIVTASIILQLLVGSKIIPIDTKTEVGKKKFQSTQKILVVFFALFEAWAYVSFGAIKPSSPDFFLILILQLAFGAFLVLLMDEVISKWGIGSGVSLFIAAGVAKQIFVVAFNPIVPAGQTLPAGLIPRFVSYISLGEIFQASTTLLPLIATIIVFLIVVYVQGIKVEIPLAFGAFKGFSRRWPLNLIYTSNIPVILVAALIANVQLIGNVSAKADELGNRCSFLGCFDPNGQAISGFVQFVQPVSSLNVQIFFLIFMASILILTFAAFRMKYTGIRVLIMSSVASFLLAMLITYFSIGLPQISETMRVIVYLLIFTAGSTIFSVFWVSTSGMDAKSVAGQIEDIGMQMPGFRRDPRIVEQVLNRYIPTLAVVSGIFLGILASFADFTQALGTGTGILLTVMIIHNLYEQIATKYAEDMHPALRKFFG